MSPVRISAARQKAAIGEYDELLTLVKKRILRWFYPFSGSSGIAKTIFQGKVKGNGRRGREMKWCKNKLMEWAGVHFFTKHEQMETGLVGKGLLISHLC